MAEPSAKQIAAWRDERLRSVTGATVVREMNLLSHVFAVARRESKWLSASPTTDVSKPPPTPPRDRRVTQDEIEKLCIALNWRHDAKGIKAETKQQLVVVAFLFALESYGRRWLLERLASETKRLRLALLGLIATDDDR